MSATPSTGPRLGLLVPCRNEAAVVARRLANLAWCHWPDAVDPHRIVVVDDGSDDGTSDLARAALAKHFDPDAPQPRVLGHVVPNDVRPGKAGAIAAGLGALGDTVDVIVLTDADVILRQAALLHVAAAFAGSPGPLMVCGSQEFVDTLGDDGLPVREDGSAPRPAPGLYDRATAVVRAMESRRGLLFSVHGQLLAWSASLGLAPTPGLAADDLDLMLSARARGARVEKLANARFLEVKTPPGERAEAQALRRARAYVQIVRKARWPAPRSAFEGLQLWCYRRLPLAAPWLAALAVALAAAWLAWFGNPLLLALGLAGLTLALAVGPGRKLVQLLSVIGRATAAERRQELGDRWEMPRA